MTKQERAKPDLINGSRRKRIAAGAGVEVSEVNKLLKMHRQMSDMMKKMGKGGRAHAGAGRDVRWRRRNAAGCRPASRNADDGLTVLQFNEGKRRTCL